MIPVSLSAYIQLSMGGSIDIVLTSPLCCSSLGRENVPSCSAWVLTSNPFWSLFAGTCR
ncbi:hypothetical protein PgNI_05938, partial [Pyricularia grisea]|uniref:Uncharacterized protein n=1 Tax=Pyricularia grisea TaxID=148305 RepID=A0A6P8B755_PYRGI